MLACQWMKGEKLRHVFMDDTINTDEKIFFKRTRQDNNNPDSDCNFFISLDKIEMIDPQQSMNRFVMVCDVREHKSASKSIHYDVTGYWVRFFGPKNKFKFFISLWQVLGKQKRNNNDTNLMKVNEICIEIQNDGVTSSVPNSMTEPKKEIVSQVLFPRKKFRGNDHTPSFCSSEVYNEMVTSFHGFLENGKINEFLELYESYRSELTKKDPKSISVIEFKLFLSIEKSLFQSVQGEYRAAKKTLQQVVSNISKSPNRTFLLNRAYSYLAHIHISERNLGTVEDCLNVLHTDRKGIPYYDLGFYYALQGESMMHFSQKFVDLKDRLQEESMDWFAKAEMAYKNNPAMSFHRLTRLDILRAQLCMSSKFSFEADTDKMKYYISRVEVLGDKLSLKNKCHLIILKYQCLLFEHKLDEAVELSKKFKSLAKDSFPEFLNMIKNLEKEKQRLEKEGEDLSSNIAQLDISSASIDDIGYDGDQSA